MKSFRLIFFCQINSIHRLKSIVVIRTKFIFASIHDNKKDLIISERFASSTAAKRVKMRTKLRLKFSLVMFSLLYDVRCAEEENSKVIIFAFKFRTWWWRFFYSFELLALQNKFWGSKIRRKFQLKLIRKITKQNLKILWMAELFSSILRHFFTSQFNFY